MDRIKVRITQNSSGNPILMFNRARAVHAQLPEGDTKVMVEGQPFTFCFRKCAVNKVTTGDTPNILPLILREAFGADVGAKGSPSASVFFSQSAGVWTMEVK